MFTISTGGPVAINSITINGGTTPSFVAPIVPGGLIGAINVAMSAGSFMPGGTVALASTGPCLGAPSADNGLFAVSGTNLISGQGTVNVGTFHIGIAATFAGASNTGLCQPFVVTGVASGAISVINANNPVTASSLQDGSGNVWSFGTVVDAPQGCWHVLKGGVAQDPTSGCAWQILKATSGVAYAYDIRTTAWYSWNGSAWVSTGAAPPLTGPGIPTLLEEWPACYYSGCPTPFTQQADQRHMVNWAGRIPDSLGSIPYGTSQQNGYSIDSFYPFTGIPSNITYDLNVCSGDGAHYCPSGTPADMVGIAAGNYDTTIKSQINTALLPKANQIYYIRLVHEWPGNWYQDSPTYGTFEGLGVNCTGNITLDANGRSTCTMIPSVWAPAVVHVYNLLKSILVTGAGGNPNIKFSIDGPSDAFQKSFLTYSNGSTVPTALADLVDLISADDYVGSTTASNSASQWNFYQSGQTIGFLNRSYLLTFAQQHNKASAWPEYADTSGAPNEVDATIISAWSNLFASVQGPGNAGIVAAGYWDINLACPGPSCTLSDYQAKQNAFGLAYPNGWGGTKYNGSYWLQSPSGALIPMPATNPWN